MHLFRTVFTAFTLVLLALSPLRLSAQTTAVPAFAHGNGRYVESPRGKIYVEVEGSGLPLVLVAGGPGGSHVIFHSGFTQVAAAGRSVIYFDNLGRGRSDRLADGNYTVDSDIQDLKDLRLGLGLEKFDLLGLSYGGIPALGYALRHPDRVRKLVLCGAEYDAQSWAKDTEDIKAFIQRQEPAIWEQLVALRAMGARSGNAKHQSLMDEINDKFTWYDLANASKKFKSSDLRDRFNGSLYATMLGEDYDWGELGGTLKGYSVMPEVGKLKLPTLVTVGRFDRLVNPSTAWKLKQALPPDTSFWTVFEKSGHLAFIEEPDAFFKRLLEFLDTP